MDTYIDLNNITWIQQHAIFTVSNNISPSHHLHPPCELIEVVINNNRNRISFPCFYCSGFESFTDYQNDLSQRLAEALSRDVVFPTLERAVQIAQGVLNAVLLPANNAEGTQTVQLQMRHRFPARAFDESSLEAPRRCPVKWMSEMVTARDELKRSLQGDKVEKDWKESGKDHDCSICIDKIESVWDSLKLPCSHVFHEKCVVRWLDGNDTCPLCRFELHLRS